MALALIEQEDLEGFRQRDGRSELVPPQSVRRDRELALAVLARRIRGCRGCTSSPDIDWVDVANELGLWIHPALCGDRDFIFAAVQLFPGVLCVDQAMCMEHRDPGQVTYGLGAAPGAFAGFNHPGTDENRMATPPDDLPNRVSTATTATNVSVASLPAFSPVDQQTRGWSMDYDHIAASFEETENPSSRTPGMIHTFSNQSLVRIPSSTYFFPCLPRQYLWRIFLRRVSPLSHSVL